MKIESFLIVVYVIYNGMPYTDEADMIKLDQPLNNWF